MKNILVIGGTSGIGRALVDRLMNEGNRVINFDMKDPGPVVTKHYDVDLSNDQSIKDAVNSLVEDNDGNEVKLDSVYFCAGIAEEPTPDLKNDFDFINKLIAVNSSSVIKVLSLVQDLVVAGGSILVVSSAHSQRAANWNPIYSGTKGFIDSFVKSFAKSLVEKAFRNGHAPVRINAVNPEMVDTPLIHDLFVGKEDELDKVTKSRILKRLLSSDEVVDTMIYLNSEYATGITGNVTPIGGNI
ncbi:SDR family oxidoreductase [Vibrio phage Va2]|nr:SDR family oxidoreductase [Vibrio phage Va2]